MEETIITIEEARAYYQRAESGHDFDHVLRVLALAERLAVTEGADLKVVRAAALLHDIARADEDESRGDDHAQMAAERAHALLLDRGVSVHVAEAITHAIATHRFRGSLAPQTKEAQILFDADKLDSIGAIGIARAYAISGALNQRLWSEVPENAVATRNQRNSDHTAVAEFVVKLSRIRERMFTSTARHIADERHAFMVDFFQRLEQEVKGKL